MSGWTRELRRWVRKCFPEPAPAYQPRHLALVPELERFPGPTTAELYAIADEYEYRQMDGYPIGEIRVYEPPRPLPEPEPIFEPSEVTDTECPYRICTYACPDSDCACDCRIHQADDAPRNAVAELDERRMLLYASCPHLYRDDWYEQSLEDFAAWAEQMDNDRFEFLAQMGIAA